MSTAEHVGSITEATGGLVEILDGFKGSDAAPGDNTGAAEGKYTDVFRFNNKDLILYALGGEFPGTAFRQHGFTVCPSCSRSHR